jgi:ribonuclease PH
MKPSSRATHSKPSADQKRFDGRTHTQMRPVKLKSRANRHAEGSCLITVGETEVLCTATIENSVPPFMRGSGKGWVTAEYAMMPRSCPTRVPRDGAKGKVNGRSSEIQRLIGRSLRSITDMTKLGERTILIDCDVMSGDGGTRCAAITGGYVALAHACQKLLKDGLITENPLRDQVAAVSVGVVKGVPCLDLCYVEDAAADVDMNVIMTGSGKFIEVQGTAEREPFDDKAMTKLIALAKAGIRDLVLHQKKALK